MIHTLFFVLATIPALIPLKSLTPEYWERSPDYAEFAEPVFTEAPLGFAVAERGTFGYWQTSYDLAPLPMGQHRLRLVMSEDAQAQPVEIRLRAWRSDFSASYLGVYAKAKDDIVLVWPSDGQSTWRVAVDVLGFQASHLSQVSLFHIEVDPVRVTAAGNKLLRGGEEFTVIEVNSPENKLASADYDLLDAWQAAGANTIYATLYGGDDTSVHPWADLGVWGEFDEWKLLAWRQYIERFTSRGGIAHLLLFERENDRVLQGADRRLYIRTMVAWFGDLPVVFCVGEETTLWPAELRADLQLLKSLGAATSVHNWPREEPWEDFAGTGLVDLVAIQAADPAEIGRRVGEALALDSEWAVYFSEPGPFQTGIPDFDVETGLQYYRWQRDAGGVGLGVYSGTEGGCNDLQCDNGAHLALYEALANE